MISIQTENSSGYGTIQMIFKNLYCKTYISKSLNILHIIFYENI